MVSNPFAKKPEPPKSLKEELGELGIQFKVDDDYRQDRENIQENAKLFTEDEIKGMKLTPKRETLMTACMKRKAYLMRHVPPANAIENPRFGRAMEAANDLLHDDMRRILSGAPEEAVVSEVLEDFAQIDILVGYSFPSKRTSILKSVAIQQAMPQTGANLRIESNESTPDQ